MTKDTQMNKCIIGYCGLNCSDCIVYKVTRSGGDLDRKEAAIEWNRKYGFNLKPEDMTCDGCTSDDGRLFGYCSKCRVRACAPVKGLATCAECEEYICPYLDEVISLEPQVKIELEKLRNR
jgi:hypothetical protein